MKRLFRAKTCLFISFHLSVLQYAAECSRCGRFDKLRMTVMSFKPHNSESSDLPLPHYECYLGAGDEDAVVTARRAYVTRNGLVNNPDPPSIQLIAGMPPNTAGYSVTLDIDNNNTFGVFNCTATKNGKQYTTIMTIFLRSDSYARPTEGLVTQTVSVGDVGITVDMNYTSRPLSDYGEHDVRWRINGSSTVMVEGPSYAAYVGDNYILINDPVISSDNGVYECHRFKQRNARHSMQRLIVRACSSSKWGPPECTGICDYCYNGGICGDESGRCICPPGFMGAHCLTACGANKFGYSCEFQCDAGGSEDGCRGRLFCLLDPFGCRCNVGFGGLNCNETCEYGTFGANCLQKCHCLSGIGCDRFTGVCAFGGCLDGWSGVNCQVPDECPEGYYGDQCRHKCFCANDVACNKRTGECPYRDCADGSVLTADNTCQECPEGFYGESCSMLCHCEADACDKVTGTCVGCCGAQWIERGPYTCQEGLYESGFSKVNPGETSNITCSSQAVTGSSFEISISTSPDQMRGLVTQSTYHHTSKLQSVFTLANVQPADEYYCQLREVNAERTLLAWRNTSFSTYELPLLSAAPVVLFYNETLVTISWSAWDENSDVGDPPIVAYLQHYKEIASPFWIIGSTIATSDAPEYHVTDLKPDTKYTVSISVVREGQGGEGPVGPSVTIKTLCAESTIGPTNVEVEVTDMKQLNVTWKVKRDKVDCSTGISGYTIYYYVDDVPENVTTIDVDDRARTWFIVSGLEPGTGYVFSVSLTTDQESVRSETSPVVTYPEQPQEPTKNDSGLSTVIIIAVPVTILLVVIVIVVVVIWSCYKRSRNEEDNRGNDKDVLDLKSAALRKPDEGNEKTGACYERSIIQDENPDRHYYEDPKF